MPVYSGVHKQVSGFEQVPLCKHDNEQIAVKIRCNTKWLYIEWDDIEDTN